MYNQEMGPGKIKVRVSVTSDVVIDEDDLDKIKAQGWEDTLRGLNQSGIPIWQRVVQLEPKPETKPAKKKSRK